VDADVTAFTDEGAKVLDLRAIEVDEVMLREGRLDLERIQRAARHHIARGFREMRAGSSEGIHVHVVELRLRLRGKDVRVSSGILFYDRELDLGPVSDLIELQHPLRRHWDAAARDRIPARVAPRNVRLLPRVWRVDALRPRCGDLEPSNGRRPRTRETSRN
jgi:hypothetical protein